MKSILFLSHSASLTGAPLLLYDIAALLDRSKYKLSFIFGEDGPLVERFEKLGDVHIELLYPDELKYWREIKRIKERISLLRKIKPDLAYCNTIHPAKWLLYARLLGFPTLTHVHELSMGFSTLSWLEHQMVKQFSQRFIAVSDAVKRYLVDVQGIDYNKVDVVRAGIKVSEFERDEQTAKLRKSLGLINSWVVGTVGRISHMKGNDMFLQFAAKLLQSVDKNTSVKFLIIGTKENPEVYKQFLEGVHEPDLQEHVVLLENEKNIARYYSAMDVYVSTAREDPFPLVILEAMASRLPIVAFAVGGIPEAVTGECGVLIDAFDIDKMVGEIVALVNNPERRTAMGIAGRKRAAENFDIKKNIGNIEEIISSLIRK